MTLARGGELRPVTRPRGLTVSRAVSRALNAAGLAECVTYAFVDPDRLRAMGWEDDAALVTLQNPLSRERSVLRPSLMPGLLDVLAINANRGNPDARVFEIGHIFAPRRAEDVDRPVHEELWAGIALTGLRERRSWSASRDRADVFDAKGLGELALAAAGAPGSETTRWAAGTGPRYLEEGRAAGLAVDGRAVGWFGELALGVREAFDLPAPVFVAELSLTALGALPEAVPRYQPLPRFPAVQRDLAIVVPARCAGRRRRGASSGDAGAAPHADPALRRLRGRPGRAGAAEPRLQPHLPGARPHADRPGSQRLARHDRRGDPRALRGRDQGRMMAENLSERLEHLERSVKQAAEAIAALRKEREALQARVAAMEQDRLELQSLRQERKDVLTQVDGILKELDKLDL